MGARDLPTERYLYKAPTSLARLAISARNYDGQSVTLPARTHFGSPIAGAWAALESAPQFGDPAGAIIPHSTRARLIPTPQLRPLQQPSPLLAPLSGAPYLSPAPGTPRHGLPSTGQRTPLENSAFPREQLGPSRCPVFERLNEKHRLVHRCRFVHLDDLLAVFKHLVNEHSDARCPICYDELLEAEDLEISHFKKRPAFFERIQYAIAHIRYSHTRPWYCRVCGERFGAKRSYNEHMTKNPAHKSPERTALSGYYDAETQFFDRRLGGCTNKEALDSWGLDYAAVMSRRHRAWPNDDASQAQISPRGDRAQPPHAAPTPGLYSQPL